MRYIDWGYLGFLVSPLPYRISGVSRTARDAPLTYILIAINTAVLVLLEVFRQPSDPSSRFFSIYGITFLNWHSFALLSYMFLHVSWLHLIWNMLFLALFGPSVEQRIGSFQFGGLYLICGILAGVSPAVFAPILANGSSDSYTPLVGASGAIAGVLGYYATFGLSRRIYLNWIFAAVGFRDRFQFSLPAGTALGIWLLVTVVGVISGFANHGIGALSYVSHVTGFLGGLLSVSIFRIRRIDKSVDIGSEISHQEAPKAPFYSDQLLKLLDRGIDMDDRKRASALLEKCRVLQITLPDDLNKKVAGYFREDRNRSI